jgi:sugar phosphate isomerase/epimerase
MKIGASVGPYHDRLGDLPAGFEFAELAVGEGERPADAVDPDALRSRLRAADLDATVHLPYRQPLATPVPVLDDATATYLTGLLDLAAAIGAEIAVAHPRTRGVDPTSDAVIDRLSTLSAAGRDRDITVCFETVGYAGGLSLDRVGDLAVAADAAVCLDVGYAYLETDASGVKSFLNTYGDVVEHLHVHGVRRRNDTHIALGNGNLPLADLSSALADAAGDATATIEVFTDDAHYLEVSRRRFTEAIEA